MSANPVLPRDDAEGLDAVKFRYHSQVWEHYGLLLGPGGRPWSNLDSAVAVLSQHPETRDSLWFDEFAQRVMVDTSTGTHHFTDANASDMTLLLQRQIHLDKMATSTVREAAEIYARRRGRHPVREWLAGLPAWDGTRRLELLLSAGFGTPQDDYHGAVGRCFLIGMVARVMQPGCQLDTMPVFEGGQGIGKTSALRILGGEWYSSNNASMQEKDFLQGLHGHWLIEIEELEAINRSSLERTKAILSRVHDDFRPPYGRNVQRFARQCVFAGSTNSDSWNSDATGARRFWPVSCAYVDLLWLGTHRDQLFAEARERHAACEDHYRVPVKRAADEQELRRVPDPWEEVMQRILAGRGSCTVDDVLASMEVPVERRSRAFQMRVSGVLKYLGWKMKHEWISGVSVRVYRPAAQPTQLSHSPLAPTSKSPVAETSTSPHVLTTAPSFDLNDDNPPF